MVMTSIGILFFVSAAGNDHYELLSGLPLSLNSPTEFLSTIIKDANAKIFQDDFLLLTISDYISLMQYYKQFYI